MADEHGKKASADDYREMEKREQQVVLTLEMLDKFQFLQLKQLCKEVCGRIPSPPRVYDKVINVEYEHHINRDDYLKFILKEMEKQEQQVILTLEMLDKFQFLQLEQICKEVCGRIPSPPRVYDKVINVEYEHHINRDDYTKFILKEMEFSEIKDFAIKYNILK